MKFSAREDIEAPIDFVFEQVTDFQAFERSALRRGAEVQRVDALPEPGVGMAWDASFKLRGKMREVKMELTDIDPPNGLTLSSRSKTMGGDMVVDLVALSRARTRLNVALQLRPMNLASRLLVQSLRLARSNLTTRFQTRTAEFARELEDRFVRTS